MRRASIVAIVISTLALLGSLGVAQAQSDCKTLVKASPFGPDDQVGATNRITPAVTKAAAAEIQTGVVIPMAFNLVDGVPLFGTRFTKTILTSASLVPGGEYGKNRLTYMEDTYLSQSHVGTHIDGMGHIGIMDCYYNQTPMGKFVTQNYLKKLGLENLKTFATRGVILDMVKVFQDAVSGWWHGDHGSRHPGWPENVQCHPARRGCGVLAYWMGGPVQPVPGAEQHV